MNRMLMSVVVMFLVTLACGAPTQSTPHTVDEYLKEYGGNRAVYENIFALIDCEQLQEQFDIASANNESAEPGTSEFKETTGYMVAADQRMKELGCYSSSSKTQIETSGTTVVNTQSLASPTTYLLPTLTKPATTAAQPILYATETFVFVLSTNAPAPQRAACSCDSDTLNCPDFSSSANAQECMEYCISIGAGDIHNLDGDANGLACENY